MIGLLEWIGTATYIFMNGLSLMKDEQVCNKPVNDNILSKGFGFTRGSNPYSMLFKTFSTSLIRDGKLQQNVSNAISQFVELTDNLTDKQLNEAFKKTLGKKKVGEVEKHVNAMILLHKKKFDKFSTEYKNNLASKYNTGIDPHIPDSVLNHIIFEESCTFANFKKDKISNTFYSLYNASVRLKNKMGGQEIKKSAPFKKIWKIASALGFLNQ